jgi:hypothetical protein
MQADHDSSCASLWCIELLPPSAAGVPYRQFVGLWAPDDLRKAAKTGAAGLHGLRGGMAAARFVGLEWPPKLVLRWFECPTLVVF